MRCPRCYSEIPFSKTCPKCGAELHFGGNTEFLQGVKEGQIHVRDIFSQTFKRHKKGDAFRSLTRHPVPAAEMLESWQRPWLYMRLFVILLAATLILVFAGKYMVNSDDAQSFMQIANVIGSTVIPLSVLMLLWEMNMQGNISIFTLFGLLLIGGQLSLVICIPIGHLRDLIFSLGEDVLAYWAAVNEEPAKIIVSVLFIKLLYRHGLNALDGLIIGAAVAAGFSAPETTGYAFDYGYGELLGRNIASILSDHALFTAPVIGALGLAANGDKLRAKHFLDRRFLITLAIGMGLHAFNNGLGALAPSFPFLVQGFEVFGELFPIAYFIIAFVSYTEILLIIRGGIRQAMNAHERGCAERAAKIQAAPLALVCRMGTFAGKTIGIPAGKAIRFGRDAASCQMVLSSASVSRLHCVVHSEGDRLLLRDLGSSNGTRLNGKRLTPDRDAVLMPGDVFELGSGEECFEVYSGKRGMDA